MDLFDWILVLAMIRNLRAMEEHMSYDEYSLAFDGEMLKRGFWLQAWTIGYNGQQYIYLDHTGDDTLSNAPSPLNGLSQHLDSSKHAPDNCLSTRLRALDIDPRACHFRMLALGPIFEEQLTFHKHEPLRDQMDRLKYELAAFLIWRGFEVIGNCRKGASVSQSLLDEVKSKVMAFVAG